MLQAAHDRVTGDSILSGIMSHWLRFVSDKGHMSRADLDPADIVRLLPHIGLIDILEGSNFRYRLVGTHMNDMFGQDFTGQKVMEAKVGRYALFLRDLYRLVCDQGMPVLNESVFEYHDKPSLSIKRLVLPLRTSPNAAVTMLLFSNTFRARSRMDPAISSSRGAVTAQPFRQDAIKSMIVLNEVILTSDQAGLANLEPDSQDILNRKAIP